MDNQQQVEPKRSIVQRLSKAKLLVIKGGTKSNENKV